MAIGNGMCGFLVFNGTTLCGVYKKWCVEQIKQENKNDYAVSVDTPDRQLRHLCLDCY